MHHVAVFTSTRADYGCLRSLLRALQEESSLSLQLIVTGTHFEERFGRTVDEIRNDGFEISESIDVGLGAAEDDQSTCRAVGELLSRLAGTFESSKPDILVLLGDRYELLAPATAALIHRIPIAHIHGGEVTSGAIDEQVRHAITKLASLHFPATEAYRQRILQLGEQPERVFNVGAPGLDIIYQQKLLDEDSLASALDFKLTDPMALVTYHPVTTDPEESLNGASALAQALESSVLNAVITGSNADPGARSATQPLEKLVEQYPNRFCFRPHLGATLYFSCLSRFQAVLGNSSSGLIEAPSFQIPVINIGSRQNGRIRAQNIIDVAPEKTAIEKAIETVLSEPFVSSLTDMVNPYDVYSDGGAGERICSHICDYIHNKLPLIKVFSDLPTVNSE